MRHITHFKILQWYEIKVQDKTQILAFNRLLEKNGGLNKNWVGISKEPYGFSNNIMGRMGPPDFEDAAFEVNDDMEVVIKLNE